MKFSKLSFLVAIIAMVSFAACKGKNSKDLIENKWTISGISGEGSSMIPDSAKTKLIGKGTMEFKKDGKYEASDMGSGPQTGSWSISDDGKLLSTTDAGSTKPDTMAIETLTSDKLTVSDKKNKITINFKSK